MSSSDWGIFFFWLIIFLVFFYLYLFWRPARILHFGCLWKRWGCCPDGITTRLDQDGSNCYPKKRAY